MRVSPAVPFTDLTVAINIRTEGYIVKITTYRHSYQIPTRRVAKIPELKLLKCCWLIRHYRSYPIYPVDDAFVATSVLHSPTGSRSASRCHGVKRRRQRGRQTERKRKKEKRSEAFSLLQKRVTDDDHALTKNPSDRSSVRRVSERRTEKRAAEGYVSRRPRVGIPKMARREPPVTRLFSALAYDLSHLRPSLETQHSVGGPSIRSSGLRRFARTANLPLARG